MILDDLVTAVLHWALLGSRRDMARHRGMVEGPLFLPVTACSVIFRWLVAGFTLSLLLPLRWCVKRWTVKEVVPDDPPDA